MSEAKKEQKSIVKRWLEEPINPIRIVKKANPKKRQKAAHDSASGKKK